MAFFSVGLLWTGYPRSSFYIRSVFPSEHWIYHWASTNSLYPLSRTMGFSQGKEHTGRLSSQDFWDNEAIRSIFPSIGHASATPQTQWDILSCAFQVSQSGCLRLGQYFVLRWVRSICPSGGYWWTSTQGMNGSSLGEAFTAGHSVWDAGRLYWTWVYMGELIRSF